jgi:hypothetical protein
MCFRGLVELEEKRPFPHPHLISPQKQKPTRKTDYDLVTPHSTDGARNQNRLEA